VAHSIAISGGTVYIAGYYDDKACYWQGTKRIDLPVPVGTKGSAANSISISGRSVYTAGYYSYTERDTRYESYVNYESTACYWQGTTRIDMPVSVGTERSMALSIALSGGTVYTAGYYSSYYEGYKGYGSDKACYWQGTTRIDLPTPKEGQRDRDAAIASSIAVDNGIVYIAGEYEVQRWDFLVPIACYWEGTTRKDLEMDFEGYTDNFNTSSIAVVNGNVYIAGYWHWDSNRYRSLACYWQGTTRIELPIPENGSRAETSSIAVVER
jgi:hypothetical protein